MFCLIDGERERGKFKTKKVCASFVLLIMWKGNFNKGVGFVYGFDREINEFEFN